MSLSNMKEIFKQAEKNKIAIGAFNFVNFETLKGILDAAKESLSPVIIAVSEGAIKYLGLNTIMGMVKSFNDYPVPFCLHLDHGTSFQTCKDCIDAGFSSVMIDASAKPFEENIALTKQVVDYAHKNGVFVEGELGRISGIEDLIASNISVFTEPKDAKEFYERTNVDSLAISIGTSHGAYKIAACKNLEVSIAKQIKKLCPNLFLVLHGASSISKLAVDNFNNAGGELKQTNGTSETQIQKAIKCGVVKVNVDSDIRIAFTTAVRKALIENKAEFDLRKYLSLGIIETTKLVKQKIELLKGN